MDAPAAAYRCAPMDGITIDTLRNVHETGYRLAAYCRTCQRGSWIDLEALIAAGQGRSPAQPHAAAVS